MEYLGSIQEVSKEYANIIQYPRSIHEVSKKYYPDWSQELSK